MNADTFLCSLPEALRVVHAVERPNFGIWVDVWHIRQDAVASEHILACGDRICGVHVNDWHTPRCFGDRAVIGAGEIELPPAAPGHPRHRLPDSLWKGDLDDVITGSREALSAPWRNT